MFLMADVLQAAMMENDSRRDQDQKGKLRGVESFGMMCSIEELGSTREMYPEAPEYGIYIFPEDAVVARVRSRHWAWMMLSLNMNHIQS